MLLGLKIAKNSLNKQSKLPAKPVSASKSLPTVPSFSERTSTSGYRRCVSGSSPTANHVTSLFTDTQKEALEKLKEYDRKNHNLNKSFANATFGEWFRRWLYELKKPEYKKRTWERYEGLHRNYIVHAPFAGTKLADITNSDIQLWYKQLGKTVSQAQVKMIHDLVKPSFTQALYGRAIAFNPTDGIKVSRGPVAETAVISAEEETTLIDYLLTSDDTMRELLIICACTGLRRGELLSLTWDDYDTKTNLLQINKNYPRVKVDGTWQPSLCGHPWQSS